MTGASEPPVLLVKWYDLATPRRPHARRAGHPDRCLLYAGRPAQGHASRPRQPRARDAALAPAPGRGADAPDAAPVPLCLPRARGVWAHDRAASFENLLAAAREALRGKRGRAPGAAFFAALEHELAALHRELRDGSYRHGPYHYFQIHDPKTRTVAAADFRDRVVHHAIVRVLEPLFEGRFIEDSYACRKGRGNHAAMRRAGADPPDRGQPRGRGDGGVVRRRALRPPGAPLRPPDRKPHEPVPGERLSEPPRPLREARAARPGLRALPRRLPALRWRPRPACRPGAAR